MRIYSLALVALGCAVMSACADRNPVEARNPEKRLSATAQRTVRVKALTNWVYGTTTMSGGYLAGQALPVSSGSPYVMGYVEADGSLGNFVEQAGYNGQLDAFSYFGAACTYTWYAGLYAVSTAGTIYLADYPSTSTFILVLTCNEYY
jgi:hypothetical protein